MTNPNQGSQFSCQNCGESFYTNKGYEPHSHGEPVEVDWRQVENISNQGKTAADLGEIERTRKVDLSNHADLLDHMTSEHGHYMGKYADWRATYKNEVPDNLQGVRPYRSDDFKLTHPELRVLHEKLHENYPDEQHLTVGDEHYHL